AAQCLTTIKYLSKNCRMKTLATQTTVGGRPEGSACVVSAHCQRTASGPRSCTTRRRATIVGLAGLMLLGGCTSPSSQTASIFGGLLGPTAETQEAAAAPVAAPPAQPQVERSGCDNAAQCKSMLKTMIDNPDRGWIGQRQSPDAYANGTRLFAYRALRK